MTKRDLEKALDLHKKAYNALLWVGWQARQHPQMLSAAIVAELQDAEDCEQWVRRHRRDLPSDAQPAEADIGAFSLLLTSFFKTSFHVDQVSHEGWMGARLTRGARRHSHGRKAKRRDHKTIRDLELIAIKALAAEACIEPSYEQITDVIENVTLAADLGLWSYACELHRRSLFASQGPAVHRMWLDMNAAERKRLNADTIWRARERLVEAVKAGAQTRKS